MIQVKLSRFAGNHEQACTCRTLSDHRAARLNVDFAGAEWKIAATFLPVRDCPDAEDGQVCFRVTGGSASEVAVALEWTETPWSRDAFIMLPAAAYNGNRYPSRPYTYPPMVHEPGDTGPDAPVLVSDVPRLSYEDGTPSRIQLLTGDLTTPAICFYNPLSREAVILLTEQGSALGNHGLTVEENTDRTQAALRIEAPSVRRDTLYTMCNTATPSWDRGADWKVGDAVTLHFRLFRFPASDVQALYDRFAAVRKDLTGPVTLRHQLPFSAAFAIAEEKHQRENWCDEGYYRVGTRDAAVGSKYQDWQVGWVGGGMSPAAFLIAGQAESRERALRNLEWMFDCAQHPSGLFYAVYQNGQVSADGFDRPGTERWYMVRKQADALYFVVKAFHALHARDADWRLPERWAAGTRRLADRFVDTFRRFGQLGQYLDCETGDVVGGGSTAAAMAPGALALAGAYFDQPGYSETAEAIARHLDGRDVRAGITTGGPGEILTCADSESAFAMLESFVVLYEVTGKPHWLARAEAIAAQCLSWCASYDYVFPPDSPFGQLDMRAAGSVWANVQNKHSSPGICTLSGDALFKLFRYTGNPLWLEQIQETAHNLPQYLSRTDRPVGKPPAMRPGYMCERVNFSDWEGRENIGGSLFGSCWPEVSLLLTVAELPGIYVQPDTGLLCIVDHVEARLIEVDGAPALECRNPTAFDASVRILAEPSITAARTILGQAAALRWPKLDIPAGATVRWPLPVDDGSTVASGPTGVMKSRAHNDMPNTRAHLGSSMSLQENNTMSTNAVLLKRGTIKSIMGETTPFVFKGRLYRLENWQKFMEIPRATCGERYLEDVVRVWDVEADRLISVAVTGHSFGTAFVWKDRVYVYSAAHPANNQWRRVTEITLTTSDDLLHWTPPEVVVRAEPGEHLFNAAVCRGPDRFILLYETDDKRWPAFTFKYCESGDLRSWRMIPDAVYGRDKYVGGPALYFEGGWYYTLYLQDLGGKWETRITRSRDLIHWDDAPADRPFLTFDETRRFHYWHEGERRTVQEINASDAEVCEWRGKTLVYFNGGDQQSAGDLQLAEFDGSPRQLFESLFPQPATMVPSNRQLAFQERQFGAFIHFGMATWYDGPGTAVFPETLREPHAFSLDQWGAMTAQPPAATFNPEDLDTSQWLATAKAMGARHVVFTAKHHNGFCLWPTATTEYGVRNSPWRDGHGDVVREFAEAARATGLGVGLYISAGDVNQGCFSTPELQGTRRLIGNLDHYFPVFETQFREILGGYGELCEIWLDGALDPFGPDVQRPDGTPVGPQYWDRLTAIARQLQPNAAIMGGTRPDVRWTGNEEGLAPYPLWNVLYPGQEAANYLPPGITGWLVPEADIFTRPSWFWTPGSDDDMASPARLMDVYDRSIGHGANLLVNMTPDRRGRISGAEATRLTALGAAINRRFGQPMAMIENDARWKKDMTLELPLVQPAAIGDVVIEEDLRTGQRIRCYRIDARVDGQWREVAAGESVGRRRIQRLPGVNTDCLRLRILDGDSPLNIRSFACYEPSDPVLPPRRQKDNRCIFP